MLPGDLTYFWPVLSYSTWTNYQIQIWILYPVSISWLELLISLRTFTEGFPLQVLMLPRPTGEFSWQSVVSFAPSYVGELLWPVPVPWGCNSSEEGEGKWLMPDKGLIDLFPQLLNFLVVFLAMSPRLHARTGTYLWAYMRTEQVFSCSY